MSAPNSESRSCRRRRVTRPRRSSVRRRPCSTRRRWRRSRRLRSTERRGRPNAHRRPRRLERDRDSRTPTSGTGTMSDPGRDVVDVHPGLHVRDRHAFVHCHRVQGRLPAGDCDQQRPGHRAGYHRRDDAAEDHSRRAMCTSCRPAPGRWTAFPSPTSGRSAASTRPELERRQTPTLAHSTDAEC